MIMRTKFPLNSVPRQTIGNIGLYYICYQLTLFGWNVLITSRNTKGVDIFIFSQDSIRKESIQVKTLSKRNNVSLGENLNNLISDYVIIFVRDNALNSVCYIMKIDEVKNSAKKRENKKGISYWLEKKMYEKDIYKGKWERIGHGVQLKADLNRS